MKTHIASAVALTALMVGLGAGAARADNLEKLENFQQTAPIAWPTIPQTGPKAEAIKAILKKIKLPPGFHIGLYAIVPDARHMAVGPQGVVTFVGTRKTQDLGGDGPLRAAAWPTRSRSSLRRLPKKIPNGPCFSKDGVLYVVEQNRVLQYPAAEFFYESPDVAAASSFPKGS